MIVEPKTIKTYQPYLCPSGLDNSDKEWCAEDPKPIDYGKFLKTFNFSAYNFWKKPVEPRFAEAIKPVLESGVCYDVLPTSRDSLSTIIGEKKSDAGTWPVLPEAHEIYRLLIADPYGQPSDAKNRLTERTKQRAKKIHDGIKRARELEDRGKTDEAQKIRLDLASEIDRICIEEDGPDKSLQMKTEGQTVIDRYETAQGNWVKANAWLAGKIALAAAAAWGLAKTGVLGKMRRAFKQTWAATRPPQDGGPVRRFFRNAGALPGRLLKSAWAAIRVKENIPPTTTPPEGGISPEGVASTTGTGNKQHPADPSPPSEVMKGSLAIKDDAPEAGVRAALGRAENTARLLAQAAEKQATDETWPMALRGELDGAGEDGRARLGRLASMLRSQRPLDFVSSLALGYMRRVFDDTVPKALPGLSQAARLAHAQKGEEAQRLLSVIKDDLSAVVTLRDELDVIRAALSVILDDIEKLIQAPSGDFHTKAGRLLANTDGLVHDSGIILDTLLRIARMSPAEMSAVLKMRGLDTSNVNGLLSAAVWINSHEAVRRGGVRLVTGDLDIELPVPGELQGVILRLMDKAGNNGVRHSGMDNLNESLITFGARLSGDGILTLSVRDNGSGMTTEKVREVTAGGKRGSGISDMMRICDENGLVFELLSEPGQGTIVRFKIDTSNWQKGGGAETKGGGVPAGSALAAPSGMASLAMAAGGLAANTFAATSMAAMSATTFGLGAMTVFAPLL